MPISQLISVRKASIVARVAPGKIKQWFEEGLLTPVSVGKRTKVRLNELEVTAGLVDTTLLHRLETQVNILLGENADLRTRLRRLERQIFPDALDSHVDTPTILPPPRPRTHGELARFLAKHGIKEDTAMRWFRNTPPLPMDPVEALQYAIAHCAIVGHRGRGVTVHQCEDVLCICSVVLQESESNLSAH
jgi:hypothetical protein